MFSRREFLMAAVATSALGVPALRADFARAAARQKLTEDDLVGQSDFGNVTIVHQTDIHAQLKPIYFREPSVNIGAGPMAGLPPHVTGEDFLKLYKLEPKSPEAYALTYLDFAALAKSYGRMGGLDRIATVVRRIRAERGEGATLFLDGGDTWQGSYTANVTKGQDMIEAMNLIRPDAMTGHWEFTYGEDRMKDAISKLPFPFLGANVYDTTWDERVFDAYKIFEKGGRKIAVIGQAFPYCPIANPRWLMPDWSFGIREEDVAANVAKARAEGADAVVLLSHNGFDVDRKLAGRVEGIDVILTGHTHDALPEPVIVGKTVLVATGSHGKFLSRIDLDVGKGALKGFRHRLIPIFSDVITPDAEMAKKIDGLRAPYEDHLGKELATTETLLYRRGNFNGTFDDLFCRALLEERDAEIAFSPGFRWGTSVLPGQKITAEDVYNACAMTYPAAYRQKMDGKTIHAVLEDVADNLFNKDPYYQQGGDMVRVGGMAYRIKPQEKIGNRISDMTLVRTGEAIEPTRDYVVAGWASVNQSTEGPPIWQVMFDWLGKNQTVKVGKTSHVTVDI